MVTLPNPNYDSDVSIEEALLKRRSIRGYTGESLTLEELSQLLWATQGITDPRGFRTAPSAGALYPLEVYVVVGDVNDISVGVYRYKPHEHSLRSVRDGDRRGELASAALGQSWVESAAVDIVIAAVYERTTGRYGERGVRYVHIEVGHAAQNLCLQATALGLGAVTVGAFHDDEVSKTLGLPENEKPLYIIPVGRAPKTQTKMAVSFKPEFIDIEASPPEACTLTAKLTDANLDPLVGRRISFYYCKDSSAGPWSIIAFGLTGPDGVASIIWIPPERGDFYVKAEFAGDMECGLSEAVTETNPVIVIPEFSSLIIPLAFTLMMMLAVIMQRARIECPKKD